jgi:Tfp pilus tip-associated adhesin PilY1
MSIAVVPFARPSDNPAPGENLLTVITPSTLTYAKGAGRTDCKADLCTYEEEMTNYANWWAYYRTRMQAMKTATSLAFEPITSSYRVGYMSINNNTGTDFQNIDPFASAHKKLWYRKLFDARPSNNTPLRVALANAGRLYAGQLNDLTFNGVKVIDPVQHYCQQNVTILSTDGYWNEGAGFKWDGITAVGDQDGPSYEGFEGEVRPQLDGGGPQNQVSTLQIIETRTPTRPEKQKKEEQLQQQTAVVETSITQQQKLTAQLQYKDAIWETRSQPLQTRTYTQSQVSTKTLWQEQTSQLQKLTGVQKQQTKTLQTKVKTWQYQLRKLQSKTASVTSRTYTLQARVTQVQKQTSSNNGRDWTDWTNVDSCSPVNSGTNLVDCQTLAISGWDNAPGGCKVADGLTTVTNKGTDLELTTYNTKRECKYLDAVTATKLGEVCTPAAKSPGPDNYTVGTAVECDPPVFPGWGDVLSNGSCDTNSPVQKCQYVNSGGLTAWTDTEKSCEAIAEDYKNVSARTCSFSWPTNWSNVAKAVGSCDPGDPNVQCRYTDWQSGSVATCADPVAAPALANDFSVWKPTLQCEVAWNTDSNKNEAWTNVTSGNCTVANTGTNRTKCRYTEFPPPDQWTTLAEGELCNEVAQDTASPYKIYVARKCQPIFGQPVNGACPEPNPQNPDAPKCSTTWTDWDTTASCTPTPNADPNNAIKNDIQCRYPAYSTTEPFGWAATTSSCSALQWKGEGNPYIPKQVECRQETFLPEPTGWSNVGTGGTCTTSPTRRCQYTAWAKPAGPDQLCSDSDPTPLPYFKVDTNGINSAELDEIVACETTWTEFSAAVPCVPGKPDTEQKCRITWPNDFADAAKCNEIDPLTKVKDPLINCQTITKDWTKDDGVPADDASHVGLTTTYRDFLAEPTIMPVAKCAVGPDDEQPDANGVVTTCTEERTDPTDATSCSPAAATLSNLYVETICTTRQSGPTPDTLADVAEYYWKTDLRDPLHNPARCTGGPIITNGGTDEQDVCTNTPLYPKQYMTTYTLGLGASGLMQYDNDYLREGSADFLSIKTETIADPNTGTCSWQPNGICNWPKPVSDTQSNIDDLWHAAVNGRGIYFSASDPSAVATSISDALTDVGVKPGALAAVTVTSTNLVAGGNNSIFEVSFKAGEWSGDVVKRSIDATTGELSAPVWAAQALLDAKVANGTHKARTIYTYDTELTSTDKIKPFLYDELSEAEKEYFALKAIQGLSQICEVGTTCLAAKTQVSASGEPLLNFIRGDSTNEGSPIDRATFYRQRAHLLGDIASSEAVYVQASPWNYADLQYGAFKTANADRAGQVYVGANDGMLHAFDAATGEEAWAYVPRIVMPSLYKLADKNYAAPDRHQFLVDATPVAGDIYDNHSQVKAWKTILVGGLNHGGRGYYALDITDPAAPKALWEFTDDNLGYTYGNPVITKLKDGTWVVIVASGYNNVSPGDGQGWLFILDAVSGAVIRTIGTGVGNVGTPSGLARIAGWANFPDNNNTTQRVYGGDLLGNLWRFDINGDIPVTVDPPVYDAQRLAKLVDAEGVAQPITSKPELGKVGSHPVVFVGTGQLLGSDDLVTAQQQSLYAIKDRLTVTDLTDLDNPVYGDYGSPRQPLSPPQTTPPPGNFVKQTLTKVRCPPGEDEEEDETTRYCTVTSSNTAVDFDTIDDGWYIDFPVPGERVNTDLRLQLGTLAFNTNTPTTGACVPVGVSYAYFLNYRTGGYVEGTDGLIGIKLGDYLSTSPSVIRLEDGTIRELIRTDAPDTISTPVPTAPTPLDTRRVSWRELVTE